MAGYELKDELQAIPGVASAQVTLVDGEAPVARIWLDGSRDAEEVRDRINALLGSSVPRASIEPERPGPKRRSGLGRGLPDLLADEDPVPSHINGTAGTPPGISLRRVGIVESVDGVAVEIENDDGEVLAMSVGTDGSIDSAVIDAVCSMLDVGDDMTIAISDVSTDEGELVIATASTDASDRYAGAAFVEFGRPWAVARAIVQAFSGS